MTYIEHQSDRAHSSGRHRDQGRYAQEASDPALACAIARAP